METLRRHRTPRWLNTRMRVARFTLPQWLALGMTVALGVGLYLALTHLPLPGALAGSAFYLRMLLVGPVTGVLGVLLYALADDRREPVIRQAVLYLLRRHRFDKGAPRADTQTHCSLHPAGLSSPGAGPAGRSSAHPLAPQGRAGHKGA